MILFFKFNLANESIAEFKKDKSGDLFFLIGVGTVIIINLLLFVCSNHIQLY